MTLLHPDLLALLGACRAAPADDIPRLVLADWLEESADAAGLPAGDARERAALIRTQVELARPTCDADRVTHLRAAEARLIERNAPRWLGGLPYCLDRVNGRQPFGFARAAAPAGGPLVPFRTDHAWRFGRGLLTVDLVPTALTDPELVAWFASPLAPWVEEAGVAIDGLSALERLVVAPAVRPYLGVRYALGAPQPPSMRLVNARPEVVTAKRCRRLLRCANFELVRELTVHPLAVQAGALAHLPDANAGGLRRLAVRAPLGDPGAALLAATPCVNLSALDVAGCEIGADGLRLLAHSPHLRQLTSLVAFRNRFGCDGLVELVRSPLADRLSVLEVQNAGVGDRGAVALAESPLLDRLAGPGLNLSMNPISDAGAVALAASPHLEPFTELILRDCRVSDRGAAALADSPHVANLKYLDLWQNRVGDAGARALAASPHLDGACEISLRDNAITARGAEPLSRRFGGRVKV